MKPQPRGSSWEEPDLRAGSPDLHEGKSVRRPRSPFRLRVAAAVAISLTSLAFAAADFPAGLPRTPASDVLRVSGNPEMTVLVARWSGEFQRLHPSVHIETHLTGSDTGMAALYAGKADVALLGRAPTLSEIQAFEWIYRYKPAQVEIMTGSLAHAGKSSAPVLFVHRDNPLAALTLAQLDALFGTDHRFTPADIRTWGQLGLTGEWANKPVHLYAPDAMSGTGRFFRHVVLNDSRMMNWAQLTEFSDTDIPLKPTHDAGRAILAALAQDRYGLAVASLDFATAQVRPVALDGIAASRESLIARTYPLTRGVTACYHGKPGAPNDLLVREFLAYILSASAQKTMSADDGYLPLAPARAAEEARKLNLRSP